MTVTAALVVKVERIVGAKGHFNVLDLNTIDSLIRLLSHDVARLSWFIPRKNYHQPSTPAVNNHDSLVFSFDRVIGGSCSIHKPIITCHHLQLN